MPSADPDPAPVGSATLLDGSYLQALTKVAGAVEALQAGVLADGTAGEPSRQTLDLSRGVVAASEELRRLGGGAHTAAQRAADELRELAWDVFAAPGPAQRLALLERLSCRAAEALAASSPDVES